MADKPASELSRGPGEVAAPPKESGKTAAFVPRHKVGNHDEAAAAAAAVAAPSKEDRKSEGGDGSHDPVNVAQEGEKPEEHRVGNRKPRGGGGNWKNKRGRGNWREGHTFDQREGYRNTNRSVSNQPYDRSARDFRRQGGFQQREQHKAEDLQKASLAQKDDKVISFDCRVRPKSELTAWLRQNKPSVLKRSDKIGYIAVISKRCTNMTEKKFTMTSEDLEEIYSELIADWERLTHDPSAKITYDTIMQLAKKHNILGGKWLCSFDYGVDDLWSYLALALAATENPMPCLAAKITPFNDTGANNFGRKSHMCSVYTEDFTDMDNVFAIEKCLRAVPIKKDLTYKPDIFTALGIYRNNKYYLKPVIYHSVWHSMSSTSVTDSVFDMDWSYQGGSGDLREVKREARKQAKEQYAKDELEAMIDTVIDRVLGKDPPKPEDVAVDQAEGIESCKGEEEPTETLSEDTDKKEDGQCVNEKPGASEDKEGAGAKSMAAIVDMMANANIAIGESGVIDIPTVVMETAAKEDSNCVEENPGASEDKEGAEPESMEALAYTTAQANIIIGQAGLVDVSTVVMETPAKEDRNEKDGICVEEKPGASEDKEGVEPKSMEDLIANTFDIVIGQSEVVDIPTMETAAKGDDYEKDGKQGTSEEEMGAGLKSMETLVDMTANANIAIGESGVVDIPSVVGATATKEDNKVKEEERK